MAGRCILEGPSTSEGGKWHAAVTGSSVRPLCLFDEGSSTVLQDKEFRERTHAFLAGICNDLDSPCLIVGGVADHVHILCRLSRTQSVSETVKELKRRSSLWIKEEAPELSAFHWQDGYGAFSISPSHVKALVRYIQNQEQHHGTESYQDEFRRLLDKYGIEYDERYVWD